MKAMNVSAFPIQREQLNLKNMNGFGYKPFLSDIKWLNLGGHVGRIGQGKYVEMSNRKIQV